MQTKVIVRFHRDKCDDVDVVADKFQGRPLDEKLWMQFDQELRDYPEIYKRATHMTSLETEESYVLWYVLNVPEGWGFNKVWRELQYCYDNGMAGRFDILDMAPLPLDIKGTPLAKKWKGREC